MPSSSTPLELPPRARITEVVPRDGLQSLDYSVSTDDKVRLVDALVLAGFTSIEVTSFMRPDIVPNLADAGSLMQRLERVPGVEYRGLVPNLRGALRAVDAGVDVLVALITATESYARKNQNRGVEELLQITGEVLEVGRETGTPVEVAIAMAFFDPYEGDTPPEKVEWLVERLLAAGAETLYLATSTGVETPFEVHDLIVRLRDCWPQLDIGLHLHNTNGMALATTLLALSAGVTRFESSLCGIGGGIAMPAGTPPVGNLATEDLVHFLEVLGVDTGLDTATVAACAREVAGILGISPRSYAAVGGTKAEMLERGRLTPGGPSYERA